MARNPTRRLRQRSADEWQTLLAQFDTSGLSVPAYCQHEAISESSFYRWRAQLASSASATPTVTQPGSPPFIDLGSLLAPPANQGRLELRLDLGAGLTLTLVRG